MAHSIRQLLQSVLQCSNGTLLWRGAYTFITSPAQLQKKVMNRRQHFRCLQGTFWLGKSSDPTQFGHWSCSSSSFIKAWQNKHPTLRLTKDWTKILTSWTCFLLCYTTTWNNKPRLLFSGTVNSGKMTTNRDDYKKVIPPICTVRLPVVLTCSQVQIATLLCGHVNFTMGKVHQGLIQMQCWNLQCCPPLQNVKNKGVSAK